jgi:hypothetical protein
MEIYITNKYLGIAPQVEYIHVIELIPLSHISILLDIVVWIIVQYFTKELGILSSTNRTTFRRHYKLNFARIIRVDWHTRKKELIYSAT